MPYSFDFFKQEIKEYLIQNVPQDKRILDVGPGIGTYSNLLGHLFDNMDALEIWTPYIEKYKLRDKYKKVYVGDIAQFPIQFHDYFILGDILEHLDISDAQRVIRDITESGKGCLVAVPYMMEQGVHEENPFEVHMQPDLTPEIMSQRYPELEVLYKNEYYGYYVNKTPKIPKAFLLYGDDSYFDLIQMCVKSINSFSTIPVIVYLLNSTKVVDGAYKTINLDVSQWINTKDDRKNFIDRKDGNLYKLLILRPSITKNALQYANIVAYVDSDSIASPFCERIFDMFPPDSSHPYFTEGIYDYLHIDGRGGAESRNDLSTTLEHNACDLFGVNQYLRQRYRQTGYYVAGQSCLDFLDEWDWMCRHPFILRDHMKYAPYHEETLVNVLLWKYNIQQGLPYVYINGLFGDELLEFTGKPGFPFEWVRVPNKKEDLLFYHGDKNIEKLSSFLNYLKTK